MTIIDTAKKRYSTKAFISGKPFPKDVVDDITTLLQLGASSVNSQPWHFIVAQSHEAKQRIAKATVGSNEYNRPKVLDASMVVVFCSRTDIDEAYVNMVTEQEDKDGRYRTSASKQDQFDKKLGAIMRHRNDKQDLPVWASRQTYLNLGSFLLGVAAMGLDAVPIEGFDPDIINQEFALAGKNLQSLALVPVGYHREDDFNVHLPKSRLPKSEIITMI